MHLEGKLCQSIVRIQKEELLYHHVDGLGQAHNGDTHSGATLRGVTDIIQMI